MYGVERLDRILDMLNGNQVVSVHAIAKALFVSEATVRRDMIGLEKEGLVRRVHGGAMLASHNRSLPLRLRESEETDSKNIVGAQAAKLVRAGDVIMLDASTTCGSMARYLPDTEDLLVITSGLKTAIALSERHIRTMVTGGSVLDRSFSLVGYYAEQMLSDMVVNTVFMTCRGVSGDGRICGTSVEEIQVRRVMASHAKRVVLLASANKIGQEFFYTYGYIEDVDDVICDRELPAGWRARIGKNRGKPAEGGTAE